MAERGVDFIGGELDAGAREAAERNWERRGIKPEFRPQAFTYEAERDTYTCPAGKELVARGTKHDRVGVLRKVYQAQAADCQGCPFREPCCPGAKQRTIVRTENVPVVATYVEKMKTEAAQAICRLRGGVAEFPNAWLKAKIGLRQFRVRGPEQSPDGSVVGLPGLQPPAVGPSVLEGPAGPSRGLGPGLTGG